MVTRTANIVVSATDVESKTITISQNGTPLGITETENNKIKIYPNPAKEYIIIDMGDYLDSSSYNIKIVSQRGVTVYENRNALSQYKINTSSLSGDGLYILQVYDNHNFIKTVKKIILN